MPFLIILWFVSLGWWIVCDIQNYQEFQTKLISFEKRCLDKGGLTLQSKKNGVDWLGCYKNGKELENEE